MTTRRTPNLSAQIVPHEYRDQHQKELDAAHRREALLHAAENTIDLGLGAEKFFDMVDELDLWEELLAELRKRQWHGRVQLVELARESRLTSVTEQ